MRTIKLEKKIASSLLLAGLAGAGILLGEVRPGVSQYGHAVREVVFQAPASTPGAPQAATLDATAGFKEFTDRVQDYVKLHKKIESTMPKLKSTKEPELIAGHQSAMARKIREAREHAKRGDIFTPKAVDAFRQLIASEFQGPQAPHAQATMQQGAPLKEVHVRVNHMYPASVPYTSVPPTLLQKLPKLPEETAYRVVSRDLVLLDVKTNVILDYIPGVIPAQSSSGG